MTVTDAAFFVLSALLAVSLLAYPRMSVAQSSDGLSVDVSACVGLESAEERFACYEERVGTALTEGDGAAENPAGDGAAGNPAGGEAAGNRAGGETSDERRGPAGPIAEDPGPRAGESEDEDEDEDELIGTIAALRERLPNQYLITLENGQIWHQKAPERYPLRVGHEVRIYPTNWGSAHRLTVEKLRGFIQVERVR